MTYLQDCSQVVAAVCPRKSKKPQLNASLAQVNVAVVPHVAVFSMSIVYILFLSATNIKALNSRVPELYSTYQLIFIKHLHICFASRIMFAASLSPVGAGSHQLSI